MRYQETCLHVIAFFTALIIYPQLLSQPVLIYKPVITSLVRPLDIVNANDGSNRLFIVQKDGIIKVYDQSFTYKSDFLTLTNLITEGESGLLGLVFHPDYKSNGFFFVYYTNAKGNLELAKYKVSNNPDVADTTTKSVIITISHGPTNHNGGKLLFGTDGYLYFATGDGGSLNAQNGKSLLGKMLRIDINNSTPPLNYSIPADNPYVNDAAIADEIWALGFRNPWRWSFDRLTHDMWIADVGQNAWEEINFRKASETKGINYGWRCYEGTHIFNNMGCQSLDKYIPPIFEYPHNNATGGFAVTGGFVYRGSEYPALNGYYIFADYVSRNQWTITDSSGNWVTKKQVGTFPRGISSFGESEDGTLFACTLSEGIVYKIEAVTDVKFKLLNFSGFEKNDIAELSWTTNEENLLQYEVERSFDSIEFEKKQVIPANNQSTGNTYFFNDTIQGIVKAFYRLKILNTDRKWDYSKTIMVVNDSSRDVKFQLLHFNGTIKNNIPELTWSATEQNILQYELERSLASNSFEKTRVVTATNQPMSNMYTLFDTIPGTQKMMFYRLLIIDKSGEKQYSKIIKVINDLSIDGKFQLLSFNGLVRNNVSELNWSSIEQNLLQYNVERSFDSVSFEQRQVIPAKNQQSANDYRFTESVQGFPKTFYRLRIANNNGNWDYSRIITVLNNSTGEYFIYPSFIISNILNCFIPKPYDYLQIFSMSGSLVLKKDIRGITGRIDIGVHHLVKGIYMVKISNNSSEMIQKIVIN